MPTRAPRTFGVEGLHPYGYRTDAARPAEVRKGVTPKVNADPKPGPWANLHIKALNQGAISLMKAVDSRIT